jgi:hypothetical protein
MLKDVIHVSSLMIVELCSIVLVIPQILFVGLLVGFLGYVLGQVRITRPLSSVRSLGHRYICPRSSELNDKSQTPR